MPGVAFYIFHAPDHCGCNAGLRPEARKGASRCRGDALQCVPPLIERGHLLLVGQITNPVVPVTQCAIRHKERTQLLEQLGIITSHRRTVCRCGERSAREQRCR
jgi:hypothetical protein